MKSAPELAKIVEKCLDNPAEIAMQTLTNEEVKNMAVILTIIQMKTQKIRDELVKIRTLMDENPMKAKQCTTNLIKELK